MRLIPAIMLCDRRNNHPTHTPSPSVSSVDQRQPKNKKLLLVATEDLVEDLGISPHDVAIVEDFPHYAVTTSGRVFSCWRGYWSELKTKIRKTEKRGYIGVFLCAPDGKRKPILVHRLVAFAFIPRIGGKTQVNHINHTPSDNRMENLEWCNQSENLIHAVKSGRLNIGEKQRKQCGALGRARRNLSGYQIKEIKSRVICKRGELVRIAREFNTHPKTIRQIRAGIAYKNTTTP